ncbi:hypothetical protein TUM19329_10980 [Legionella antarctica]|uniref:Uncharacterized protein n=2 Tax=Legionella antarctica TaxID=2708020 RepID=A0A6F8T3J3_9GAMM|nr:hypothetical protein TUM19329_10980 [Legionella antarctica]
MLIPLGVTHSAQFFKSDLAAKYSPYPVLLTKRLCADDLINVYSQRADDTDKKNLAKEMVNIEALCIRLQERPRISGLYGPERQ